MLYLVVLGSSDGFIFGLNVIRSFGSKVRFTKTALSIAIAIKTNKKKLPAGLDSSLHLTKLWLIIVIYFCFDIMDFPLAFVWMPFVWRMQTIDIIKEYSMIHAFQSALKSPSIPPILPPPFRLHLGPPQL